MYNNVGIRVLQYTMTNFLVVHESGEEKNENRDGFRN